jgi:hypothetical protein
MKGPPEREGTAAAEVENHQATLLGLERLQRLAVQERLQVVQQHGSLADAEHAELGEPVTFEADAIAGAEDALVGDRLQRRADAQAAFFVQRQTELGEPARWSESGGDDDEVGAERSPAAAAGWRAKRRSPLVINVTRTELR